MYVRSKFTRVRSLWKPCARAHAHSLEGTLVSANPTFMRLPAARRPRTYVSNVGLPAARRPRTYVYQYQQCVFQ